MKIAIDQAPPGQSEYLTKPQIAERMKVTTRTIDAWMAKGFLPYRKIGRTVRFMWGEVSEHLARRQKRAQSPHLEIGPGVGIAAALRERAKEIRRTDPRP